MRGYVARNCYSFTSVSFCRPVPWASRRLRAYWRLAGFCLLLPLMIMLLATGTALAGNTLSSLEEELAQLGLADENDAQQLLRGGFQVQEQTNLFEQLD